MDINLIGLIRAAVLNGTPLLFGTSGEILTEKSGNLNLGVEGLMFMGGAFGLCGAFVYGQAAGDHAVGAVAVAIALLASFAAGVIGSLIFSFLTITLRANQNVTGLALTIFGTGVGQFVGELMRLKVGGNVTVSNALKDAFANPVLPKFLQDIPVVGPILFSYNFFVYLGFAAAIIMAYVMAKTRCGLSLCAVGESPATADAAGINVTLYKYLSTCIGAGICGIGGLYYVLDYNQGIWATTGQIEALGWLAVALGIFTTWKPLNAIWGAYLFGMLYWLYQFLPSLLGITMASHITDLVQMLPYVVTIIVLIVVSMRKKKENQPPAHLGLAYFREER